MRNPSLLVVAAFVCASTAGAQQQWTVDATPLADVRGMNDAGAVVFGMAHWATRLRNGTLVVADGFAPALHFIDAAGKLVKSVGRAGQGPGDFRAVLWVGQCARDSVFAWDFPQLRVTTYDAAGNLGRTFAFGTRGGAQTSTSCNAAGALALFGAPRRLPRPSPPDPNAGYAIVRIVAKPLLIGSGGDTLAVLPEVPYGEIVSGSIGGRMGGGTRPLGPSTSITVGVDRVYLGRADSGLIAVHALDGTRVGTIPLGVRPRAATRAHYERAADAVVAMWNPQMRAAAREWILGIPAPATLPSPTAVFVDPTGLVWAVLTAPGDPDTRLRAFRSDGSPVADVTLPHNITVFEVGAEYVLGSYADQDDEVHVVAYRVRRGR
jgi:hypothetical protein